MTIDLNQTPPWNFSVVLNNKTLAVREPTPTEFAAMTDLRPLSNEAKVDAIDRLLCRLTGLDRHTLSMDQTATFFAALVQYALSRMESLNEPIGDRPHLFN